MTRGEEIIIQSYDYGKFLLDTGFSTEEAALKCMRVAFIDGARWADAHNEGLNMHIKYLKEELIDKACELLYEYNRKQTDKMFGTVHTADVTINVAEFREAMKGE